MELDALLELLKTKAGLTHVASPEERVARSALWRDAEVTCRFAVPDDFKQLINATGSAKLGKGLAFFSPDASDSKLAFSSVNFSRLFRQYELGLWRHGLHAYPGDKGVLPIAACPKKIRIVFAPIEEESASTFEVALVDLVTGSFERHGRDFYEFLARLVEGTLQTSLGTRLTKQCGFGSS
jgi:hypothetical protein